MASTFYLQQMPCLFFIMLMCQDRRFDFRLLYEAAGVSKAGCFGWNLRPSEPAYDVVHPMAKRC
jgi:hypothetical protein